MVDGLPPSVSGIPPMGSQPATQATGNPGNAVAASAKVRQALDLLSESVIDLPDELKRTVQDALDKLRPKFPGGPATQQIDENALRQFVADKQKNPGLDRLAAGMQGGGGGPPGAPPGGGPGGAGGAPPGLPAPPPGMM
jgi:hypothetical protein